MPTTDKRWASGDYFVTFTGRELDPLEVRLDDIDLRDIAHALSLTNRYGGHSREPYSVAAHCVYVSREVDPFLAKHGLMHDAAEAYVGDLIKCVKRLCPQFETVEHRFAEVIAERFGLRVLTDAERRELKRADVAALLAERRDIFGDSYPAEGVAPGRERIEVLDWRSDETCFLSRAAELGIR